MEITLETLHKFARQFAQGPINIVDSTGTTRKLEDGRPDVWELALKADQFWYAGTSYPRANFAQLMEDAMRPANPVQIGLPDLPREEKK
jgi:hypothetical protein